MLAPLHLEIIPNLNIKVLSPIRKRKNEKTLQNCWALGFNFFSTLWTQYCNQLGRYNILHLSTVRHSWTRDNYQQTDKIKNLSDQSIFFVKCFVIGAPLQKLSSQIYERVSVLHLTALYPSICKCAQQRPCRQKRFIT